MFKWAICNEVWGKLPIEEVFAKAASMGYHGVEIAPFTLADSVDQIDADRRRQIVEAAAKAGVEIVGLHWLFVSPPGLHMTTPDDAVRGRTVEYLKSLVNFCGDLGGKVMIFGSPKQRNIEPPNTREGARSRLIQGLRDVAPLCQERGVTLCLEALSPKETNIINTIAEACRLVDEVKSKSIDVMLDIKAMASMPEGVVQTIEKFGRRTKHVHANDPSRHAPGMGDAPIDFYPVLCALIDCGYRGWISVEPFIYDPSPDVVASTAIETLKAAMPES